MHACMHCVSLCLSAHWLLTFWQRCRAEHLANAVIIQCCGREHYNSQSPLAHRSNCIICSTGVIAHTSWCSAQRASSLCLFSHSLSVALSVSSSYARVAAEAKRVLLTLASCCARQITSSYVKEAGLSLMLVVVFALKKKKKRPAPISLSRSLVHRCFGLFRLVL